MNEEHLGQLQQVLNDLEEGLRMRQQDKARIVELENCIKGLIFSDIIRNDGDFITMRGIAINNLDRACKAIGATIDLDALCTAQLSACVIGGTGISSSMRGALAEAGRQPSAGVVLPDRKMFSEYDPHPEYPSGWNDCLDEVERLNPCRAVAVPDGWRVSPVVDNGVAGFVIGTPRANGVRYNTSVWVDDEDPAHQLLAVMLAAAPSAKMEGE